jgi:hypothetical protein
VIILFDYVSLLDSLSRSKDAFEEAKSKYDDYCFSTEPIKNSRLQKVIGNYRRKEKLYKDSVFRVCSALKIFSNRNYVIKLECGNDFIHVFFGSHNEREFKRHHGHIVVDVKSNRLVYSRMPNQPHGPKNHLK